MSEEATNPEEGEGIKNLRKQYEATQKELAEARKLLEGFQAEKRSASVVDILKAKGVDEAKAAKTAKFYAGEDTSEDAVGKWLEENADVFGLSATKQAENDEAARSAARVADATTGFSDGLANGPSGPGRVFGDPAEIQRALDTLPYEELQKLGYMPKDAGNLYRSGR